MATLIFDFDGTLVDSLPAIIKEFNKQAYSKIHLTDLSAIQNLSIIEIIQQVKIPFLKLPLILNRIRSNLRKEVTTLKPFPGINETLQKLKEKNHKLGILTSNSTKTVTIYLKHQAIEIFDFIYSEKSLFKKTRGLKKLLNRFNISSIEAIYIGDESRDIIAAKQCGIRSAAVTWGLDTKQKLAELSPDFIVTSPAQLLDMV